jgi:hypothetical protein
VIELTLPELTKLLEADMAQGCRFEVRSEEPFVVQIITWGYEVSQHVKDFIAANVSVVIKISYIVKDNRLSVAEFDKITNHRTADEWKQLDEKTRKEDKIFLRMTVPLKPGEEKPRTISDFSPEGFRMETDSEFRDRVKREIG